MVKIRTNSAMNAMHVINTMNANDATGTRTRERFWFYRAKKRSKCCCFSSFWTPRKKENFHHFAYLFVYLLYIGINVFTTAQLYIRKNNYTDSHYIETIIMWNIVHLLSMVPDLWASSDTARIFRTVCSNMAALLQTVFWWVIFPKVAGEEKKVFVVEYLVCSVLFLCEVTYRLIRTRNLNRLKNRRVLPTTIANTTIANTTIANTSSAVTVDVFKPPVPPFAQAYRVQKKPNVNVVQVKM